MPDTDEIADGFRTRIRLRRVWKIVLCLLAGAMVNVAVAWGSFWYGEEPTEWNRREVIRIPVTVPSDWPSLQRRTAGSTWLVTFDVYDPPSIPDSSSTYVRLTQRRAGFPMRSYTHIDVHDDRNGGLGTSNVLASPLWIGGSVNTILYAAAIGVAWTVIAIAHCARRRRLGLCPSCAYDLRGTTHYVCPECGRATG